MKRYKLETTAGNTYLLVDTTELMVTVADENDPKNGEFRAMLETICRIASKGMAVGVPLEVIREQMIAGDMGRGGVVKRIADKIGEFLGEHKS